MFRYPVKLILKRGTRSETAGERLLGYELTKILVSLPLNELLKAQLWTCHPLSARRADGSTPHLSPRSAQILALKLSPAVPATEPLQNFSAVPTVKYF